MSNKKIWLISALILAIAIAAYLLFPENFIVYTGFLLLLVGVTLWRGDRLIWIYLDKRFPWDTYGKRRFFIHLLLGYLLSIGIINVSYFALRLAITKSFPDAGQILTTNVFGLLLFVPIFSMYFSIQFLNYWRKSEVEMEHYQKESVRSELKNLKNHLDPHFLFNNLNILSTLIDKSPERSKQFLGRFAQVYRKMLQSTSEDLVTLEEELSFIDSYIYLIETRFGKAVTFKMSISESSKSKMLPPLTLQMLIENAVKHNIGMDDKPLSVEIVSDNEQVVIKNNLNLKKLNESEESGSGLDNIRNRIAYFSNRSIVIEETKEAFSVAVPLFEIEEI